ncbi:MAG: hypothetical protein V8R89_01270 [Alphaproteobacteria bacterium]
MKNIAMKLLVASTVVLTSACSGAGFPSLLGGDSAGNGNIVVRSGSYEDAKGANTGTFVGQKIIAFRQELEQIKVSHQSNREELTRIQKNITANSTQYNNTVGSIESKLQIGTTPGNPNLYNMLQQAQNNVQTMSMNANALNNLSVKVANDATSTVYLIDSIRAAFSISGAVDEDHRQLHNLQNEAEQLLVSINSINSEVNDDSARQQQYLVSAQNQIGNLNTAIRVGSFRNAAPAPAPRPVLFGSKAASRNTQTAAAPAAAVRSGKPLFVAKFKNDNVSYKEGLSTAVKAAVNRKSNTVFEVVAVSNGSAAGKAQEHANKIFEEIAAMGVNPGNINLSAKTSAQADGAEVWIFVH